MRNGYQVDFLGSGHKIELPQPGLAVQADILQPPGLPEGELVIPYINYSLIMSRSTKQALYSAANVNLSKMQKVPSKKGRNWFVDGRVGASNQIPNYPYVGTQWDRGHLTRRTAVTWGDDSDYATRASNDSCAYTNACMQHKNFNEDDWRAIELLVSSFTSADKLNVMTGPIFTRADRYYTREFEDFPVRIPAAFWKIVTYVGESEDEGMGLRTQAYIFFQDLPSIKDPKGRARIRLKDMQVTTTEISLWTGLEFDSALFESNPLKFYSGPEVIPIKERNALLKKHANLLELDAGITSDISVREAREKFPLEDFYEIISEVGWV
ncbi:DNA/RNA non-specific endonuclease [Sneathiella sp.]|uniref:DNA/RNA non-specific endonuclease n=1 Tax=Sneathiella sp. TaxID=1964365 RepID=UPI00261F6382|nr:DNA/RNA non-specific endonuclease [Sneathiella sp.]MDF2368483.1 DNA/RNA non-specific endonuclease [Sneathiella sp.]